MKDLIIQNNTTKEEFELLLNQATNYQSKKILPAIKFNAEDGMFYKNEGNKNADGKPAWEEFSTEINAHIILSRRMVNTSFNTKTKLYSREFDGSYVELYNEKNEVAVSGLYSTLKEANPDLVYIDVLYLYLDNKAYKMKLSGSKLSNWFAYKSSSNPALYITKLKQGEKKKNGSIYYYELLFEPFESMEMPTIVSRVNAINSYIRGYEESRGESGKIATAKDEFFDGTPVIEYEEPLSPAEAGMISGMNKVKNANGQEINIENIPF